MKKVTGHSNLYKTNANAVVNTDYSAFLKAKERKRDKEKMNGMEERLNRIEHMLEMLLEEKLKENLK
jgi:hypothetical protein